MDDITKKLITDQKCGSSEGHNEGHKKLSSCLKITATSNFFYRKYVDLIWYECQHRLNTGPYPSRLRKRIANEEIETESSFRAETLLQTTTKIPAYSRNIRPTVRFNKPFRA